MIKTSAYAEIVSKWQSYNVSSESGIDKYLDNFRILFAYHSGKIENPAVTYANTREIFENGKVIGYTGDPRAIFEQSNQKLCYEFLKSKIITKEPITLDFVKEVHKILTAGTYDERRFITNSERPGEFKKHDYVVGLNDVGADVQNVEADLNELLAEINQIYDRDKLLTIAAYFHAKFESIHPFADGNGRVGRTLMNYFLMINSHPPFIIFDEDKEIYYEALNKFDEKEDIELLKKFFVYEVEKTWAKNK